MQTNTKYTKVGHWWGISIRLDFRVVLHSKCSIQNFRIHLDIIRVRHSKYQILNMPSQNTDQLTIGDGEHLVAFPRGAQRRASKPSVTSVWAGFGFNQSLKTLLAFAHPGQNSVEIAFTVSLLSGRGDITDIEITSNYILLHRTVLCNFLRICDNNLKFWNPTYWAEWKLVGPSENLWAEWKWKLFQLWRCFLLCISIPTFYCSSQLPLHCLPGSLYRCGAQKLFDRTFLLPRRHPRHPPQHHPDYQPRHHLCHHPRHFNIRFSIQMTLYQCCNPLKWPMFTWIIKKGKN